MWQEEHGKEGKYSVESLFFRFPFWCNNLWNSEINLHSFGLNGMDTDDENVSGQSWDQIYT